MNQNLNAGLYARVSSQRQADDLTIQSQVAALRERIQQDSFVLEEELCFLDDGYSGATLLRPALERLRDLIHCGGLDRLYVHSPDRLSRNYAYQFVLLEEFRRHGVTVVFLNDDPQQPSAEKKLLLQVQGIIAEYERAKIMERARRGRKFAARQGKISVLGHAPYGYRYVSKAHGDGEARYDIVLEEAQRVREMFQWVGIEGVSLSGVADRLSKQAVPTPKGNTRWDKATIRGILVNPAYTGTAKYGKTRIVERTSGRRPKRGDPAIPRCDKVSQPTLPEEQESIPVPALVSLDLFEAVAKRLEENRQRYREQKRGSEFLLSGLLVCNRCKSAYCGRRMSRTKEQPYVYYRCLGTDKYRQGGEAICSNKSVNGPPLESAVWADLCSLLQEPGRLQRELERRLERPPDRLFDSEHHEKSIANLKRRMSKLLDAYENGWVEKDEFESRIRRVKEQLTQAQELLAEHQRNSQNEPELRLIIGQFQKFADQIASGLAEADFTLKRNLLRLLINRIEVDLDEVRIVYKVQIHPFVLGPDRGQVLQHCLRPCEGPSGRRV
jgi:site-specific DNA recombinase